MKALVQTMKTKYRALPPSARQGLAYLLFGGLTTLVNWACYFGLVRLFGGSAPSAALLNAANTTAWIVSVLFAYATNRTFVFEGSKQKQGQARELALFFAARLSGYFLFDLAMYNALTFGLSVPHGVSKILCNVLVVIYNYAASKWFIFKKDKA